jgi:hypothetical protein
MDVGSIYEPGQEFSRYQNYKLDTRFQPTG